MKPLNERPKQLLPNGKRNPEYTKWYKSTEKGKSHLENSKKKYREEFPNGSLRCVECKSVYHKPDVVIRGWKIIGNFGCLCDICE